MEDVIDFILDAVVLLIEESKKEAERGKDEEQSESRD